MEVPFTKMHGLGNDFVLLDERKVPYRPDPETMRRIADRRRGVGCDQILILSRAGSPGAAARYTIFNADGTAAEHCGNGVRCVARYLSEHDGLGDEPIGDRDRRRRVRAVVHGDGRRARGHGSAALRACAYTHRGRAARAALRRRRRRRDAALRLRVDRQPARRLTCQRRPRRSRRAHRPCVAVASVLPGARERRISRGRVAPARTVARVGARRRGRPSRAERAHARLRRSVARGTCSTQPCRST